MKTKQLDGSQLTRGNYGVRADKAHAMRWNGSDYEPATEQDVKNNVHTWMVFDPDWGWLPWRD